MKQLTPTDEIMDLFAPVEGGNAVYYGKVGGGKTSTATADILDLVKRGEVVLCNWKIDFKGYDERTSFSTTLLKFFGGRDLFFNYKSDNLRYFEPDAIDIAYLGELVNVHLFIDEGQWIFPSHAKDIDPEKRKLVLHGRHYCRSLNIITQRPMNINKDFRSQVDVWYKCEKKLTWPFLVFQKSTITEILPGDNMPNEEIVDDIKVYKADDEIFRAYNTHAMRSKTAMLEKPQMDVYQLQFWDKVKLLGRLLVGRKRPPETS